MNFLAGFIAGLLAGLMGGFYIGQWPRVEPTPSEYDPYELPFGEWVTITDSIDNAYTIKVV